MQQCRQLFDGGVPAIAFRFRFHGGGIIAASVHGGMFLLGWAVKRHPVELP